MKKAKPLRHKLLLPFDVPSGIDPVTIVEINQWIALEEHDLKPKIEHIWYGPTN